MPKSRILVVEDEGLVSLDIKENLEELGYEVSAVAATGSEAIRMATESFPDLILMDIHLAGEIDGIEAANQIRETLPVPVIYLTAYADDEHLQRAAESDPYGYLLKPFHRRALYAAIETALHRAEADRKVQTSESWLSGVLTNLGDGIVVADIKGAVKFANAAAERMGKWNQAEITGRRLSDIIRIQDAAAPSTAPVPITVPLLERKIVSFDNGILLAGDGSAVPIEFSAAPVVNKADIVVAIALVLRDVVDRKGDQELAARDRATVSELQKSRLPRGSAIAGMNIEWLFHPIPFGSGDLFDYFALSGDLMGFYMADVEGHGFNTALISMTLRRLLSPDIDQDGLLMRRRPGSAEPEIVPPASVIEILNQRYQFERNNEPFFTMVYGYLDSRTGRGRLVRAGHQYPLLQKATGEILEIKTEGYALGLFADSSISEYDLALDDGDRLFLYSDELVECRDDEGNQFSLQRLSRFLTEQHRHPLPEVVRQLDDTIRAWRGHSRFDDDVAFLALERAK